MKDYTNTPRVLVRKESNYSEDIYSNSLFVTFTRDHNGGNFYCQRYIGKQSKPANFYRFRTEERRSEWIAETKKAIDSALLLKAKQDLERKERKEIEGNKIQVGTILYSSWGYDQTNIDYYQVLERSGSSVKLVALNQKRTESGWLTGECEPIKDSFAGEPFTKRINASGNITMASYASAWLWDGRPKRWSSYA